jgi:hypothetical protein
MTFPATAGEQGRELTTLYAGIIGRQGRAGWKIGAMGCDRRHSTQPSNRHSVSPPAPREVTQLTRDWSRGDQTALGRFIPVVLQRHAEHVVPRFEGAAEIIATPPRKCKDRSERQAGALEAKTGVQNDLRQVVGRIADMYAIWGAADKAVEWRKTLGSSKD